MSLAHRFMRILPPSSRVATAANPWPTQSGRNARPTEASNAWRSGQRLAAVRQGTGRTVRRYDARRPAVPGARPGAGDRRLRPGSALGRAGRGDLPRATLSGRARSTGTARPRPPRRPTSTCRSSSTARPRIGWSRSATSSTRCYDPPNYVSQENSECINARSDNERPRGLGPRARLHGLRRPHRPAGHDRADPRRGRAGRDLLRHGRGLRPLHATRSWSARRSSPSAARS